MHNAPMKKDAPLRSDAHARRARRPIALDNLRGFAAAARQLSFTRAAADLNLTQSSISRQVATLEEQLGVALFERRTRALDLTAAGERLQRAVRSALETIDDCVDELRAADRDDRVTIATFASFASLWLGPRLPAFQAQHPQLSVRIDAADRKVDLVAEGVDLAIRWSALAAPPVGATLLVEDESTALVAPRLVALHGMPATPRGLLALPLLEIDNRVAMAPEVTWAGWLEAAGVTGVRVRPRTVFSYMDQLVQAAIRGQGAIIGRLPYLWDLTAAGDLVAPFPELRFRNGFGFFLLLNPQRSRRPAVKALADFVVAEFQRSAAASAGRRGRKRVR
jgi:LysR family transcriptional regulator, glycine cleavage system transcriptional activator